VRIPLGAVILIALIIGAVAAKPLIALMVWLEAVVIACGVPGAAAPLLLGVLVVIIAKLL
jgi:hypothetical protein